VHAAVGTEHGHKRPFKRVANAVGLVGPMSTTTAGPVLSAHLTALVPALGPYPHAALRPKTVKRQTTRLLLILCVPCDYKLRGAKSTLDRGIPHCPVCGDTMVLASPPAPADASCSYDPAACGDRQR
jgi:hypothetical protein